MERLTNLESFQWIQDETWTTGERPDGGDGNTVRHCLPPRFESYFKLLHPIYIDKSITNKKLTWDEANKDFKEEDLEKTTWKDLADEYNVKFVPEISFESFRKALKDQLWPRYIIGPDEGNLEPYILKSLEKILVDYTSNKEAVYFCYFFLATEDWDVPVWRPYKGRLKDVHRFKELDEFYTSPTYWWPEDKSWCVCSDYDLEFTLIGGSKELIEQLYNAHQFEGLIVDLNTRIDYKADTVNL